MGRNIDVQKIESKIMSEVIKSAATSTTATINPSDVLISKQDVLGLYRARRIDGDDPRLLRIVKCRVQKLIELCLDQSFNDWRQGKDVVDGRIVKPKEPKG